MAFTRDGAAVTVTDIPGPGSTLSTTSSNNLAAGRLVVVNCFLRGSAEVSSVTDSAGNTYTALASIQFAAASGRIRKFYCLSSTANASNIWTAHYSASNSDNCGIVVQKYQYGGTAAFVAGPASASGNSTTPATTSFTASNMATCFVGEALMTTTTPNSGWTTQVDNSTIGMHFYDRIDTPGGTIIGGCTAGDDYWGALGASFSDSAGGGATDTPLTVTSASITFSGQDVTLVDGNNKSIVVDQATVTIGGQDVALLANASITMTVTSADTVFQLSDVPFQLNSPWTEASLTLTGQDVTLSAATSITLAVTEATISFSGSDVTLLADFDYTLTVTEGTLTFTGQDVSFQVGAGSVLIDVGQTTITLTGQDIGINPSFSLPAAGTQVRRKRYRGVRRLLNVGR